MCGIIGYTGLKDGSEVLLQGLSTLEYRGYDSAGIYMSETGLIKSVGDVGELKNKISKNESGIKGKSGIGHLRWATHGEPTEDNAHPHQDCEDRIFVVHNGIIENYAELKLDLEKKGHAFKSATDTEVIAHLIEENLKSHKKFEDALFRAVKILKGTFGLAIIDKNDPDKLYAVRMGAPVLVGLGKNENFIASDVLPILKYTKDILYLEDGDVAILTPKNHKVFNVKNKIGLNNTEIVERKSKTVNQENLEVDKKGYEHFMLKEIFEAPQVIKNVIRGRVLSYDGTVKLGGLDLVRNRLNAMDRIIIVGCGTAYYSGLYGKYLIEEICGIPVEVDMASEFKYRNSPINEKTTLIALSQSGETIDTLYAVTEAKKCSALTLGIINVVGSSIAREVHAGIYNHAGPEIGVASTKAFVSQITALALFAINIAEQKNYSKSNIKKLLKEIELLPKKIEKILKQSEKVFKIAEKNKDYRDFLFIGRKYEYPIALEGALKLKEVSYIHAEGYGAGEMKHGPLAMIDEDFPTVALATSDSVYEKMISNIEEIKARKGKIFAIANEGDEKIKKYADNVFYIPKTEECLMPILSVIPLQLFAYKIAVLKNLNVDRPRNLAKSVTVE